MAYLSLPPAPSYPSPYAQTARFSPGIVGGLGQEVAAGPQSAMLNQRLAELRARANEALAARFQALTEGMQKQMMKSAAYQAVAVTSISAIPVVGWIAGPIAAIAGGVTGAQYQAEAKKIMEETVARVQAMQAASQARIDAAINRIFRAEYAAAMQLAQSGQPLEGMGLLRGLGGLFDKVSDFLQKEVYDPLTGRGSVVEARSQRDKVIKDFSTALMTNEAEVAKILQDPNTRLQLRVDLAKYLRQDPAWQQYVSAASSAGVTLDTGLDMKALAIPAVAAGAVIAASLLL